MFAEPYPITVSAVTRDLWRVGTGDNSGSFKDVAGSTLAAFSHTYGKRSRHNARFTDIKTTADPLVTGSNFIAMMGMNLTFDLPPVGYTAAEAQAFITGCFTSLTASSGANIAKILSGQS